MRAIAVTLFLGKQPRVESFYGAFRPFMSTDDKNIKNPAQNRFSSGCLLLGMTPEAFSQKNYLLMVK